MISRSLACGVGVALLACAGAAAGAQSGSVLGGMPQFSPRPHPQSTQPSIQSAPVATQSPSASQGSDSTPQAVPAAPAAPQAAAPFVQESGRRELTPDGTEPFYVLHPGDTVDVTFRYTPEFNDEVVIGPDGRASLKSTGDIKMAGRTLPELRRLIVSGSTDKLVNPDVAVSLKDFERPNVVVAGEVANPQRIELRRPTTVLQAILIAGGPRDDAALGRVLLFRRIDSETAEVHVLKLGRYDARTRAQNDLVLEPNDMILVRHDIPSRIERYVKMANIGLYLNPFGNNGIF